MHPSLTTADQYFVFLDTSCNNHVKVISQCHNYKKNRQIRAKHFIPPAANSRIEDEDVIFSKDRWQHHHSFWTEYL
jgi:hypothetical protein